MDASTFVRRRATSRNGLLLVSVQYVAPRVGYGVSELFDMMMGVLGGVLLHELADRSDFLNVSVWWEHVRDA